MAFEVFSPFMRCAELHDVHRTLSAAAACYNQIDQEKDGEIPTWKSSGKYVHVIAKVSKRGNILDFTRREVNEATALGLPLAALLTQRPGITSFPQFAKMYYEASRTIPISALNLQGMFDHEARDKHYWATEAGIGSALAHAQQVAFTLELSLKALLETMGKLVSVPKECWQTHDLVVLYSLLEPPEQQFLQQQWRAMSSSDRSNYNTLSEFLTATKNLYMELRYIPTLKSANLSMDTQAMLNASLIVLRRSDNLAIQLAPIKPRVSTSVTYPSAGDRLDRMTDRQNVFVQGTVVLVKTSSEFDFDPNSPVEVVIRPIDYFNGVKQIPFDADVTAVFRKCNVESYFGLEGEMVTLSGWVSAAEQSVLKHAQHTGHVSRGASYQFATQTLRGQAYNLLVRETSYGGPTRVTLILRDSTFLSDVDCFFVTEEEKAIVENVTLGAEITISGHVTLLNGRPVSLVGPSLVD